MVHYVFQVVVSICFLGTVLFSVLLLCWPIGWVNPSYLEWFGTLFVFRDSTFMEGRVCTWVSIYNKCKWAGKNNHGNSKTLNFKRQSLPFCSISLVKNNKWQCLLSIPNPCQPKPPVRKTTRKFLQFFFDYIVLLFVGWLFIAPRIRVFGWFLWWI